MIMYAKMIEDMQANMKQAFDMKSYETAMKPMTDLFEINKATVEALAEQQTALVKELAEGAMEQAKALSAEKDLAAVVESQKSYLQAAISSDDHGMEVGLGLFVSIGRGICDVVRDGC